MAGIGITQLWWC